MEECKSSRRRFIELATELPCFLAQQSDTSVATITVKIPVSSGEHNTGDNENRSSSRFSSKNVCLDSVEHPNISC